MLGLCALLLVAMIAYESIKDTRKHRRYEERKKMYPDSIFKWYE